MLVLSLLNKEQYRALLYLRDENHGGLEPKERNKEWLAAWGRFEEDYPQLRADLENEFRTVLLTVDAKDEDRG